MALSILHTVIDKLALAPGVRHMRERVNDKIFLNNVRSNFFRGVFDSFEAAANAVPRNRPQGYDNEDASLMYRDMMDQVYDYDYPSMFWLQRSFAEGFRKVFDLGGHVGIKYYAFKKNMHFNDDVRWTVGDLPVIATQGRAIALQKGESDRLSFADTLDEMAGCDVLFASGSLQYLPKTLAQLLEGLDQRPRRIIVNITPIHDETAYFTVNSIGVAYCPYRVQHRDTFIREVQDQGYVLRGAWLNQGKTLDLPFNEGYGLSAYSGFCFDVV